MHVLLSYNCVLTVVKYTDVTKNEQNKETKYKNRVAKNTRSG